jgi:DNA-binding MarR family transcriptional regulator
MTGPPAHDSAGHPANGLNDVVHQRVRLGILTIAHEVLENAGLVALEKGYAGKRARTWITITKAGQAALAEEIAQLKLLISRIDGAGTPPS